MPTSRRLYVHIGLPKTGTSFLQAALLHNREVLAEQGLDLVPVSYTHLTLPTILRV